MRRILGAAVALSLLGGAAACGDTAAPRLPVGGTVVVLNTLGQSLVQFDVNGGLEEVGTPIALPENFDGDAADVANPFFVTSISALGGSQLVIGDLDTGERQVAVFPGPDSTAVDPSKPTFGLDGGRTEVWVAGRGDQAIYRFRPGETTPMVRIAEDIGRWVERVVPLTDRLVAAIDANLDTQTFQPAGPSRVFLVDRRTGALNAEVTLEDAFNATDVLTAEQRWLIVLASGTLRFEDGAFVPEANGAVVIVDALDEEVAATFPLEGNGLSIRPGRDGRAYITRTRDFEATDVLVLDPFAGVWLRGPDDPVEPTDGNGDPVPCWTTTALEDGRLLCATFRAEQSGHIHLFDANARSQASRPSGFGSVDLSFRR